MDDSNKSVLRFRVINCDRRPLSVPVPSRLVRVSFPRASTGGEITATQRSVALVVNPYSTYVPYDAEPR